MKKVIGYVVLGIISLVVVLGLFCLLSSCTTISSGEVGVISKFGKIQEVTLTEGLNFKAELLQKMWIEKWNGVLPTYSGDANLMLDMTK